MSTPLDSRPMRHLLLQCPPVFLVVLLACSTVQVAGAQVTVIDDSVMVPTYLVNDPNSMPRFYEGGSHQGVQRRVYPYPMNDNLTSIKEDRNYHVVYLENEYLRIGIMPGLGGRIFEAIDKTNGYNFFYRNHVIKPSLIGMVGYWISGGNAWGFPHHHGPNTVRAMDYRVEEHADGGATVWIANTDLRHRMRILVGYTIYPGSSVVEMTVRPFNRTPMVNSMLFWANPSVHVDENYQVVFPPSVEYVTQHAKREMTSWPIADNRYNGYDYEGVDISWWKNIGVPSSFFSWDPQEDFFGGYDHAKEAGTAWVGNHHVMPGMKFWAWGNNPGGDRANSGLTDEDGHYIELMVGAYTDNQPDYSWLQPYEGKDVTLTWFPMRELDGLKAASTLGGLNLALADGQAQLRANTTEPVASTRAVLEANGQVLSDQRIDIAPDQPYVHDVDLVGSYTERDLRFSLLSAQGDTLLTYRPEPPRNDPRPEPLQPPAAPEDVETVEELYLTGLRLNQFYNASVEANPYYLEALRRDPGHYDTNTQLGIRYLKREMWKEAEQHLQRAVDRATANYTRSRDGEAQYYLGLAQRRLAKTDAAYDNLYDATWSAAFSASAYYQLAEIDSERGDFEQALDHLERSLSTNAGNHQAQNMKVSVLRELGHLDDAASLARSIAEQDPLDHRSRNELYLLQTAAGEDEAAQETLRDLDVLMRDEEQSYLELATEYGAAGLYAEAVDVLERMERKGSTFPMVYYYLGYYSQQLGNEERARDYHETAAAQPHRYNFPFRTESIAVLEHAFEANPEDAMAPYYLGNLLYEKQPQRAVALWEKSRAVDGSFYIVHRNLGWAYQEHDQDIQKALASYEEAYEAHSGDPRLLYELDLVSERAKVDPAERYRLLAKHHDVVAQRSESLLREALLAVKAGNYDEVINILVNNTFPQFEGGATYRETYQNAYMLRGQERYAAGEYAHALADFEAALDYPVGRWGRARQAQFHYFIGTVYEAQGEAEQARAHYGQAVEVVAEETEYLFEQALALQKLGRHQEASESFDGLSALAEGESSDFFRQFETGYFGDARRAQQQYLRGLVHLGAERTGDAQVAFAEALKLNPSHVWAEVHLQQVQ